ncbi:MAG: choice-of-anchor J domain-containing protein, partial [Bacteroidales bacterium]|nr:choice-of-anchor J domain-containing protein [Bacteroidales bacterium]
GSSVQFNNTTSGNYVSASWTFDGGSPATSTATSPTVTYNTHGTYDATLTIVNTNGCSSSATEHITVYEAVPPVADFSASETYIMAENSVTFTDLSTNMPTSWSWTFEGGTPATSTEQNPTVTYNEAGEYTVTLVATNAFGSGTETKTEYISVAAVYDMSNETIYACGGTYKDPGGDGNYGNNARYTQTIYPSSEGAYVRLTFTQLGLQQTTNWNTTTCNDYITIYDGTSTSATQIGQYCGTNPSSIGTNGVVTATNDDGALTIYFYSNNRTTNTGWEAEISCYVPEPEVAVQSYTPATAHYGTTNDLSVTFVNNGGVSTSASTTATLSTTDEYITLNTAEQTIGAIARNVTASTTFSFTVAENVPDGHVATINVAIADGNRTWNETLTITAIGPSCEQPTGLQVALNGTTATITWDAQANTQFAISDDFEGHTYGTINSPGTVGWTYIDGDNLDTNDFSTINFTNEGSKMAFIVLDDEEITGSYANANAYSGDKFIGAPYVSQNDDWIISPELNFTDDFTFSFFARSYSYNYTNEQFYAAYSTTGNSAGDFMNLDDVTTTTTTWTEYSYTVPADAKYVAIHCVSTDVYMFCVDDISISGNVVSDVVVNLYDNGILVASNVTGGTYTVTDLSAGEHCFSIRAVCNDDSESLAAQSCVNVENITPPPTYTITINAGNGGSISPNGTQTVNEGGNFTFTVTPNDCYEIASVTVNGAPITLNANNSYTIQNVTADQTINATFNQISYAVTTLAGNGGSINNAPTSVNCGEGYTFTVTPNDCYEIASVTVNGTTVTPTNNIYTIANVTEAQSINATFNRLSYIITASASEGGSITPSGDVEVNCGDNKEFVIAANEGYEIENVVVDGQSQGAITNYTFENVTEAGHSIEATFNQIIVVPECNAVTNLVASVENYGIVLSWNAVENASSYDIYRNGERIATETNTSAIDLQGHEGDRYYIITNCANGGTSDASEMITATAEPTCNAITDLTAMVESYGIALAWEAAENAVSYDIYCNGNRISTATTTSYIDLQGHEGDTYYIITNCANGGTSDASESATAIVTSISEVENNIAIFPNPANDILNITSSETISEIEIVNTLGQVVYRVEVNSDNAVCDVNELASGVYVVKIHTLQRTEPVEASLSKGTAIVQKKFVKE